MKKITKTNKTPAPATKLTAPAPARKSAAAPKAVRPAAMPPAAVPVSATKPAGAKVSITAKVNVGFGNALFIRGGGAGLSWDKGAPLACQATDTWSLVLPSVGEPFAFKLLLNDEAWSTGKDYHAGPGETVTVTPEF